MSDPADHTLGRFRGVEWGPQLGSPRPRTHCPGADIWVPTEAPRFLPPETHSSLCLWRAGGPPWSLQPSQPLPQRVCVWGTMAKPPMCPPIHPPAFAPITPLGPSRRETGWGGPQARWALERERRGDPRHAGPWRGRHGETQGMLGPGEGETGGPRHAGPWRGRPAEQSLRVRGVGALRRGQGPGRVQARATAGRLGVGRARGGSGSGAGPSLQGAASSVGLLGLPRRTR